TTQEFKLFHGRGGLYIGKAILKNNVFVLGFVPDLGTADSDGIVTFTSWTHPPDLDPDFSLEGFWYSHTIPEAERTRALATIQHSAAAETTSAVGETTSAAAETSATPTTVTTPVASSSTTSPHIDNTSPTPAQQLTPPPREVHRSANFTAAFYSNSDLYRRSPGHRASEDIWHTRMGHPRSQLATYLKMPEDEHMKELDRALHYLVSTPTIGLIYFKSKTTTLKLIGYVDIDHAGDPDNRRSRTGYIYRLEPIGPISWQSSKQELVALSSAEAEYFALCSATKEGLYLIELLEEAKLAQLSSFSLFCDNQSAIRIANKNEFANRTKHIALRYFFVKDEIEMRRLELSYYPTSEMAADYLTKKLGKSKFEYCMLLTGQSHVTCSDTPEAKGIVGNN
ncbi:unnamed protein product, partial [Closterium sp. NIES-54]